MPTERASKLAVPALHAALAIAVVPWGPFRAQPFSSPKLLLFAAASVGFAALALRRPLKAPAQPRALGLGWMALLLCGGAPTPQALLLDASAALLLLSLLHLRWDGASALRGIAWTGALVSTAVLLQALWPGPRLRLYGTLGNPDFCAAWIGAALCVALVERRRAAAAVQIAALAVIGSFATLLALSAAGAVALAASRRKLALSVAAAGALCLAAAARDPVRVLQGRIQLHRVAAAHLFDAPLLGLGPGAVRLNWPQWDASSAAQDHVHDDWLERAIEQGIPSALLLAALTALALRRVRQQTAAAAAVASLAARAFVDFPLARPAELALFVTLIALCLKEDPCQDSP